MLESIGTLMIIVVLAAIWFGRDAIKEYIAEAEEDMLVAKAKASPKRAEELLKANEELENILQKAHKQGISLTSAKKLLQKSRGH